MGAGADYDSLLCVTVGTGIGGALIMNGEGLAWRRLQRRRDRLPGRGLG